MILNLIYYKTTASITAGQSTIVQKKTSNYNKNPKGKSNAPTTENQGKLDPQKNANKRKSNASTTNTNQLNSKAKTSVRTTNTLILKSASTTNTLTPAKQKNKNQFNPSAQETTNKGNPITPNKSYDQRNCKCQRKNSSSSSPVNVNKRIEFSDNNLQTFNIVKPQTIETGTQTNQDNISKINQFEIISQIDPDNISKTDKKPLDNISQIDQEKTKINQERLIYYIIISMLVALLIIISILTYIQSNKIKKLKKPPK